VTFLPTPNASDYKGSGATQGRTRNGKPRPPSDADLPEAVQLLPTPRASDTGTPGRRASEGWRPPLSQVVLPLLPTPRASDGEKGGPNQRGSKGDLTLSSAAHRIGAASAPPSPGGKPSPDDVPPGQLTIEIV